MAARLSFRDRLLTRRVARTMLAPSSILLAGAGASVAILTGLPLVAAPLVGLAAWAARVATAMPRNRPGTRINPLALPEAWRHSVMSALDAQKRFARTLAATEPGPLRERLAAIGARIDDGVDESWQIANRGWHLQRARTAIDTNEAQRELAQVERDAARFGAENADPDDVAGSLNAAAAAIRSQLDTAARLDRVIADAHARLRLLDARLDEAVARSVELSAHASDVESLTSVGADVENLVSEMEALRQALEETSGPGRATGTAMPA